MTVRVLILFTPFLLCWQAHLLKSSHSSPLYLLCTFAICYFHPLSTVSSCSSPPYLLFPLYDLKKTPMDKKWMMSGMSSTSHSFCPISFDFLTYKLLSYFVCLHCTNIHIPLPSFSFLMLNWNDVQRTKWNGSQLPTVPADGINW